MYMHIYTFVFCSIDLDRLTTQKAYRSYQYDSQYYMM